MPFAPPDQALPERFRVDALLAAGDRCSVYRAWDLDAERTVVLKQFRASDAAVYLRESAAGLSMSHPNLLTPREALYPSAHASCLVFEYMAAGTLRDHLDRHGPLSPESVRRCIEDLLSGLTHLHLSGWVHRDLKPDNVFLEEQGGSMRFLIGDLGSTCTLAEARAGAGGAGAPAYSAPETRFRGTTVQSDLYSLAVVAFEAATGELPFARNLAAVRKAQLSAGMDFTAIDEPDLRDFLTMLLEPDPARRCPDAGTALSVLEGLRGSSRPAAFPLRLTSRSRSGQQTVTRFTMAAGALPRSIKILGGGGRQALLLEHSGHLDLLHLSLPCKRQSLPNQHAVTQLGGDRIAFVAGHRLQILDACRGSRAVIGNLPRAMGGCHHDGKQALCLDAVGYHLMQVEQGAVVTTPFAQRRTHAIAPALCLVPSGGFAASEGAFNQQVAFYDAKARRGQCVTLPDSVLALAPGEQASLLALTLSTRDRNRYTLWQLHRFLEPRRYQTEHPIVAWSLCGVHLDLLFEDGEIGRVRDSHIDTVGRIPMTPSSVHAFAVTHDSRSIAVLGESEGHQVITLINPIQVNG